jgi:hypothetical protein
MTSSVRIKNMNGKLLDKVDVEKIEALIGALDAMIIEMRSIEKNRDMRFRDDTYCMCLSLYYSIFEALKRRANVIQGE